MTPTDAGPLATTRGVTARPDGNMWFTQLNSNGDPSADDIGKITSSAVITDYQIPTANSGAWGIASGGHGNLYFTELAANNIAQITASSVITEFAIPTLTAHPTAITPATPHPPTPRPRAPAACFRSPARTTTPHP